MITRITSLNLNQKTIQKNENKQQGSIGRQSALNPKNGYDSFERGAAPAFTGKTSIKNYEQILSSLNSDLNTVKNSLTKYAESKLPSTTWKRASLAIATLGLSEGIAHLAAKRQVNRETGAILDNMRENQDAQNGIIDSDILDTDLSTQWILEKIELEANHALAVDKIKREQIVPLFISTVLNKTEVPNCLMISCGTENINNELIEWTKAETPCEVVTLNDDDDIVSALKAAKKHYQQTGERTLMHIKNFDTLINPKTADEETIGAMKGIMGDCANRYYTTILFSSQKPDELDKIAMGPHRVERIEGNLKTMEEQLRDIAFNQINELDYTKSDIWLCHDGHRINPSELQELIKETGLYNEIPPIGKEFSMEDMLKIRTRMAEVIPEIVKNNIANAKLPREVNTTPAKFYIKSKDGTIKEYNGYKHTVRFLSPMELKGTFVGWEPIPYNKFTASIIKKPYPRTLLKKDYFDFQQSYFTMSKDFDAPDFVLWANILKISKPFNETSPVPDFASDYYSQKWQVERRKAYDSSNADNYISPAAADVLLQITDKIFNENKDKYKTGIPEIDFNTDVYNSPFSLRSMLVPVEYNERESVEYPKTDDKYKKYADEDLMGFAKDDILKLKYYDITYALSKDALPQGTELLAKAFYYNIFPDNPDTGKFVYTPDKQKHIEKENDILRILPAESREEAERIFALEKLKDKKWCADNPVPALKELIFAAGLDKEGVKLSDKPDSDEMSAALRAVRDNLIKVAMNDMENINYLKRYHELRDIKWSNRAVQTTRFQNLPALMLIADEHIADKDGIPESRIGKGNFSTVANTFSDKDWSATWLDEENMLRLSQDLEHYEFLSVCSDALSCITRNPAWKYKFGYLSPTYSHL